MKDFDLLYNNFKNKIIEKSFYLTFKYVNNQFSIYSDLISPKAILNKLYSLQYKEFEENIKRAYNHYKCQKVCYIKFLDADYSNDCIFLVFFNFQKIVPYAEEVKKRQNKLLAESSEPNFLMKYLAINLDNNIAYFDLFLIGEFLLYKRENRGINIFTTEAEKEKLFKKYEHLFINVVN